jgi:hypothetical protein
MGTPSGIKRKAPDEGQHTLGFHMTGDGTISARTKVMNETAILFGGEIINSNLW